MLQGALRSSSKRALPLIDVGALYENNLDAKLKVSNEIGQACEHIGFFGIANHRIPPPVMDDMLTTSKQFFDLDEKEKNKMHAMSKDYPYGYSGIMGEVLSSGKQLDKQPDEEPTSKTTAIPDLKESFSMGPYNPASGVLPPIFPSNPRAFESAYMTYYQHMEDLTSRMCQAFALALNLPINWFEDKTDRHRCCIRSM